MLKTYGCDTRKQGNRIHQTSPPVRNLLPLYTTTESNGVAPMALEI